MYTFRKKSVSEGIQICLRTIYEQRYVLVFLVNFCGRQTAGVNVGRLLQKEAFKYESRKEEVTRSEKNTNRYSYP